MFEVDTSYNSHNMFLKTGARMTYFEIHKPKLVLSVKENWTGEKFNLVMFLDMGLLSLNSIFSAPHGQK